MTSQDLLPAPRTADPTLAPTLRWGISSTGGIAASMTDALHRHTRQDVVAVSSRSQATADRFAATWQIPVAYEGLDAMLADDAIDIVYIASPHSHHHADALAALRAGKHVLVEKAFTRDAAQAREVLDVARGSGLIALEAMWTRFLPGTDVIRQLLADAALGEVVSVLADHGQWFAPDPEHRLFSPALAGGALLDLGIYPLAFADFALPGVQRELTAIGDLADTGVDRQVCMTVRSGRALASLSTTLAARTPTTASIDGSRARVELAGDFYLPTAVTLISRDGERASYDGGPIRGHEALAYEAAHLAQLVADGADHSPLLPPSATLRTMELLDSARAQVGVVYPGELRGRVQNMDKVVSSAAQAVANVVSGSSLAVGGFGLCGIPSVLIAELLAKGVTDLSVVSNNCGVDDWGLGVLLREKRIRQMTASYVGENKEFARQYLEGELEVRLTPQGTLAEKLRAGGAGIPAFYTATGVGTQVADGGIPWRYDPDGSVALSSPQKETRQFEVDGVSRTFVLEEAIVTDVALVRAHRGDRHGNLVFHETARNFNPLAAMAGRHTIAEVEELVEPGVIAPDDVHLPGIYVHRVLGLTPDQVNDKRIEKRTVREPIVREAGR